MLVCAIKGVYASVYYRDSKAYMTATSNVIDQEKMAVILQEVVGKQYGDHYYPNISGVLRLAQLLSHWRWNRRRRYRQSGSRTRQIYRRWRTDVARVTVSSASGVADQWDGDCPARDADAVLCARWRTLARISKWMTVSIFWNSKWRCRQRQIPNFIASPSTPPKTRYAMGSARAGAKSDRSVACSSRACSSAWDTSAFDEVWSMRGNDQSR